MNKHALALVAVPATAILLTACGTASTPTNAGAAAKSGSKMSGMPGMTDSPSAPTAATHNAADVTFAQSMIPHHRQAIAMAQLADTRAASPALKQLAMEIEAAQDPEITQMTDWLKAWKAEVPGDMTGMDGMPGMMSAADMTALTAATGAAVDKAFLTMMIAHHQGALSMARTEVANGADAQALTLALMIINGQTKEIAQMKTMLGG